MFKSSQRSSDLNFISVSFCCLCNIFPTATNSVKANKNENEERGTNTAIGNTMCQSYTEVTKNGLKEN